MSPTRIYKVTTPSDVHLIDASTKANAIAFVARLEIQCEVASGHDIAILVAAGITVEHTNAPAQIDLLEGIDQ